MFVEFILTFVVVLFFLPYRHQQKIFGSTYTVKTCESILVAVSGTFFDLIDLSVLLFATVLTENLASYSLSMFQKTSLSCTLKPKLQFSNCYKKFRCTKILLNLGNIVYSMW